MAADLLRRVRRGPIPLVLLTGNALAVAAAFAATAPLGGAQSRSTIGRTWPIAEPDALAESAHSGLLCLVFGTYSRTYFQRAFEQCSGFLADHQKVVVN